MKTCDYQTGICYKRQYAKGYCKYHYGQHYRGAKLTDQADLRLKHGAVIGSTKRYTRSGA